MATVLKSVSLTFTATLTLSEAEMRALDALVGYGDEAFLKQFKDKLGAAYIRDHEAGLKSFFGAVRRQILPALGEINEARRALAKTIK